MEPEFDPVKFEQNLTQLKNSQHSIQSLSSWCTERRSHHKKIVTSWLNVLKQVKIDQRLILFNLANDVIQNSKRKNYEFVASWGTALQRATTMVRQDPKVKQKIARIFKIWEERSIYNEEFLADLNGLLNTVTAATRLSGDGANKAAAGNEAPTTDPDDFQSAQLISHINQAVKLQEKTDKAFKLLSKAPEVDVEKIRSSGKDREHVEGIQKEVSDSVTRLEQYIYSMKAEIKARNILIAALGQADEFYRSQRGDVKTVAIAYRNFGLRIKTMKKKLDELTTTLPSPIPSPDINAPSPPPDADLELPEDDDNNGDATEHNFSSFLNGSATTSGFLGSSQLPFNISDFSSGLAETNDTDQRNAIQVLQGGQRENSFSMAPLPVPPVQSSAQGQGQGQGMFQSGGMNNHSQTMFGQQQQSQGHHHQQQFNQSGGNSGYGGSYSSSSSASLSSSGPVPALVPPPRPPQMDNMSEEYTPTSSWNAHTNSWSSNNNSGNNSGNASGNNLNHVQGVPPPMNANHLKQSSEAPPFFERREKRPGQSSTEYNDGESLEMDQRSQMNVLLSKNVDHRNLISLTGSPGGSGGGGGGGSGNAQSNPQLETPPLSNAPPMLNLPPAMMHQQNQGHNNPKPGLLPTPPAMPTGLWSQPPPHAGTGDSDFRGNFMQSQGIPPPPMPPVGMGHYYGAPQGNIPFNNFNNNNNSNNNNNNQGMFQSPKKKSPQGKAGDNIDTVDMEMSDEEQDSSGHGPQMDNNGPPQQFMNFPPPGPMGQQQQQQPQSQPPPWGGNGGMPDSPVNGGQNAPWNQPPHGGFFPVGPPGGSPMFGPQGGNGGGGGGPMNFRGRGGFNRGGGGGGGPGGGGVGMGLMGAMPPGSPGNGMFRGRGSPFRGGNFRGNRGNGRGMW